MTTSSTSSTSAMKQELNLFLLAIQFYTRIPAKPFNYDESMINHCTRYVGLVGLLVGFLSAGVFAACFSLLGSTTAAILAVLFSILLTGAFHEDGLADTADGFGGAFEAEKVLTIMKDSRVGTYGVVALVMSLSLRISLIASLTPQLAMIALPCIHALSRIGAVALMQNTPYAQLDQLSKVKPVAKQLSSSDINILLACATAVLLTFGLIHLGLSVIALLCLLLSAWCAKRLFIKKIGGYTGDCLGALEQVNEVLLLIALISLTSAS